MSLLIKNHINIIFALTLIGFNTLFYLSVSGVSKTTVLLVLFTSAIMICIVGVKNNTENKVVSNLLVILYFFIVAIIFINKIYFSYFNSFLSMTRFLEAGHLSSIGGSVKVLYFNLTNILFSIFCLINLYSVTRLNFKIKRHFLLIGIVIIIILSITVDKIKNQDVLVWSVIDVIPKKEMEYKNEKFPIQTLKNDNAYYGIAKNKNVIVIQMESAQNMLINKIYNGNEITPNLNNLIKNDSIYFDNYFQQIGVGNTVDAEFTSMNSIYPVISGSCYEKYTKNDYEGLPKILKEKGYSTYAFHGYDKKFYNRTGAYEYQGIDKFYSNEYYNSSYDLGFGINDKDFLNQVANYMTNLPKPFFGFVITLSSHHPYNHPYRDCTIKLKESDEATVFGNYLLGINYLDSALGKFIEELKEKDLYDDSIIVLYGDHHGISMLDKESTEKSSEFLGKKYNYDDMMNVPLIIHMPGLKSETNNNLGSQMDFMPTMLNLLGINKKIVGFGKNILIDPEEYIAIQTYIVKGSFITKDAVFSMSRDGNILNSSYYDRKTSIEKDINENLEYIKKIVKEIDEKLEVSKQILDNNLIKKILSNQEIHVKSVQNETLVSHAGGRYMGKEYTNSIESLQNSVKNGFKFIELDFTKTTDNKYALIHDFDYFPKGLFVDADNKMYSSEEFKKLNMKYEMTQMIFEDLALFIRNNRNIYIITDSKDDNVEFMKYMSKNYPDIIENIIPQIYSPSEYIEAQKCGFSNIILTLYTMTSTSNEEVYEFAKNNKLFAITMPEDRVQSGLAKRLDEINVFTYLHTINDEKSVQGYKDKGVDGFYTDDMIPSEISALLPISE
ncbi:MAG TPA: hypothetical protein DCP90_02815 [Clostridiales bacterium]|nr:MAG: hypothetical protein A2Y22_00060 [Clostridiales bacterium GWD2_32_59]HAN09525.1 hypothetical protein [Clostridiales bacterium]